MFQPRVSQLERYFERLWKLSDVGLGWWEVYLCGWAKGYGLAPDSHHSLCFLIYHHLNSLYQTLPLLGAQLPHHAILTMMG